MAELYTLAGAMHSRTGIGQAAQVPPTPVTLGESRQTVLVNSLPRPLVGGFPALASVSWDVFGIPSVDYGIGICVGWPYPVQITNVSFDWTTWRTGSGGDIRFKGATAFHADNTSTTLKGEEARANTVLKSESISGTWNNVYSVGFRLAVGIPSSGTNAGNLRDISITGTHSGSRKEFQFHVDAQTYGVLLFHPDVASRVVGTETLSNAIIPIGGTNAGEDVLLGGRPDVSSPISSLWLPYRILAQKERSSGNFAHLLAPATIPLS